MTTMSKVDIIKDTVKYYCDHKRALDADSGQCVYFDASMKARCAVGRFSISKELDQFPGDVRDFVSDIGGSLDEFLEPRVRGYSIKFWDELQILHDTAKYWKVNQPGKAGKELTDKGRDYYRYLLEKYGSEARS